MVPSELESQQFSLELMLRLSWGVAWVSSPSHSKKQPARKMTEAQKPLKIDIHTHILPRSWPDLSKKYGYGGWISMEHVGPTKAKMMLDGKLFREVECNCYSSEVNSNLFELTILGTSEGL